MKGGMPSKLKEMAMKKAAPKVAMAMKKKAMGKMMAKKMK